MGWDQHYSGHISFMRAAKPGTGEKDRFACEDGEEWEKFYFMIRDKTEDCRLLDYTCHDKVDDNSSMAYSIAAELNELRPRHAVGLLHDMARLIGKWGCYLAGNLFVFTEGTEQLSRVLIDKNKLRYYTYSHEDPYECTEQPSVKLQKCDEIDLRDLLDPNGEVPPDPDEEHRNECKLEEEIERLTAELEERKRKRAKAKRLKSKELICPLDVKLFEKHVSFMHKGKKTKGYVYSKVGLPDKLLVRWRNNHHDVAYQYATLNRNEVLEWDTF